MFWSTTKASSRSFTGFRSSWFTRTELYTHWNIPKQLRVWPDSPLRTHHFNLPLQSSPSPGSSSQRNVLENRANPFSRSPFRLFFRASRGICSFAWMSFCFKVFEGDPLRVEKMLFSVYLKYSFSGSGLSEGWEGFLNIRGSNTTLKIQCSKLCLNFKDRVRHSRQIFGNKKYGKLYNWQVWKW